MCKDPEDSMNPSDFHDHGWGPHPDYHYLVLYNWNGEPVKDIHGVNLEDSALRKTPYPEGRR